MDSMNLDPNQPVGTVIATSGEAPPIVAAAPSPAVVAGDALSKKILTIPSNAMSKIRQEERNKGKNAALADLDKRAKALGFADFAAMEQSFSKKSAPEPAEASGEPAEKPDKNPRNAARLERENLRLIEDRRRVNRLRAHAEKQTKSLQRKLDATEAENQLRIAAVRAGVADPNYALHLLREKMTGKTITELEGFDETKFFDEELRGSHPHLFKVESRPATTGTSGDSVARGAKAQAAGTGKALDARTLSNEDFAKLLASRGLSMPSHGMPS